MLKNEEAKVHPDEQKWAWRFREIVILKEDKGYTFAQIAEHYGFTRQNAHKLYHHAKKKQAKVGASLSGGD
jgi:DNA-directed RNA polymerase specialized sigma24 family protein